ncbi:hypothetical protein CRENPOLYSF2_3120002 [Crenothrix polyspora]|uniref:Uncharacterized protein n=1 Tax=Crenothrix polyspora TaxID=360316 RepID=A0A1R4HAA0_9GAMM|nr:hypothetical protein [Crenothrix polyspora]SJM93175.1 hypothetical protein CRENPOLYSF2_3120002 [Crenothrix polyspora]
MYWHDFLNSLESESIDPDITLLLRLASMQTTPDIYWYPGSGTDLTPLLLDVPNNPLQRRLFRVNQESEERPLLLWMNDNHYTLEYFPDQSLLGKFLPPSFREIWKEYGASVTLGKHKECYRLPGRRKLTLFTAIVKNQGQGIHDREEGDEYLVCFSSCNSVFLLHEIFIKYNFHLFFVALIAQDLFGHREKGFSRHKEGFCQYLLPNLIINGSKREVDFWAIDIYGQDEEVMAFMGLGEYEYIGGPINWGWPPSRLFGRPGVSYLREQRPYRFETNWSKTFSDTPLTKLHFELY